MSIYSDGAAAQRALADYIEKYSYMIEEIRKLCVHTLAMGEKARREQDEKNGRLGRHCFTTPDEELRGQESMAYMILDELGLEVDHWFCGTPILKDKEADA